MSLTNADDLINAPAPEYVPVPDAPEPDIETGGHETLSSTPTNPAMDSGDEGISDAPEQTQERTQSQSQDSTDLDDYGNKIDKKPPRVYTQEEVNEMIRDRLSRGQFAQQQENQVQQQQQQQQSSEPQEDWQKELEEFTLKTLEKREQLLHQQQWQQQERNIQAQFEAKFNQGMAKYPDFEQTIMGKGLTPQMVIATRGMSDPAAFLYAAAKSQPKELERIASIPDNITQAVELGKLEERMRKTRRATSAPAPGSISVGDTGEKRSSRNIDDMIINDAKNKARRI